jgi:hypothetical protein
MPLPELQAWFMTVMTAPGGVERGEALAAQRHGWRLGDVLAHGHGPAPAARMRIYADGYALRLLDCLRADYPLSCKLLGDDLFQFFARAYIARHPPASPSLYDLGAGFAGFLAGSQAGSDDAALRLPVALARLERARIEAGRAPGLEGGAGATPVVSTLDILMGHDPLLRAPSCLRLLELETPVLAYAESLATANEPPPAPEPRRSLVAVTRKAYRIGMAELADWQYHFLAALAAAGPEGATAGAAGDAAARQAGVPMEQVRDGLLAWLPAALAAGLLAPLDD